MVKTDIKTAVSTAMTFVKSLYSPQSLRDLLLEEVELSSDETEWLVTIGFSLPSEDNPLIGFGRTSLQRHYKIVRVNAETGAPVSMKIRES